MAASLAAMIKFDKKLESPGTVPGSPQPSAVSAPRSFARLLRLGVVTGPSLLPRGPRQLLSWAILWQREPLPDPLGGGRGAAGGKAGMWATAFSQRGEVSWHEWEFMAKHGQPHSIQRSQLPHLQGPQELVICRAVTGLVGKVLVPSFWKTS